MYRSCLRALEAPGMDYSMVSCCNSVDSAPVICDCWPHSKQLTFSLVQLTIKTEDSLDMPHPFCIR